VLDDPEQIVVVPEIEPGVAGIVFTVIASVCGALLPQELFAVTVIFPEVELAVVVMLFVVDVPVQPPGKVHVYDVAPATELTEYVLLLPEHTVAEPEIDPGVVGTVTTETKRLEEVVVPHEFVAETNILPDVELAVALIEFVVEVPVQPDGKVQL
jgi:hypothetical protein